MQSPHVFVQVSALRIISAAKVALEWLLAVVDPEVVLEVAAAFERLAAAWMVARKQERMTLISDFINFMNGVSKVGQPLESS